MIPSRAFYVDPNGIRNNIFELKDDEFIHAYRVLRLSKSSEITLLDGLGNAYQGKIKEINKNSIKGIIVNSISNVGENKIPLEIGIPIIKINRFEFIIEKATELGVNKFYPILFDRGIKKSINHLRIKKIIKSASKQCKRSRFPILCDPKTLVEFLKKTEKLILVGMINSKKKIYDYDLDFKNGVSIIVGPEGGFSPNEIELMKKYNLNFCNLGKRILRSETAVLHMLSIINETIF